MRNGKCYRHRVGITRWRLNYSNPKVLKVQQGQCCSNVNRTTNLGNYVMQNNFQTKTKLLFFLHSQYIRCYDQPRATCSNTLLSGIMYRVNCCSIFDTRYKLTFGNDYRSASRRPLVHQLRRGFGQRDVRFFHMYYIYTS